MSQVSKMGRALRQIGSGPVLVVLRQSEVGYAWVRDQKTQDPIGPAIGLQAMTLEATGFREVGAESDLWEFTMTISTQTPAGEIPSRSLLYIGGEDILLVRVASQLKE